MPQVTVLPEQWNLGTGRIVPRTTLRSSLCPIVPDDSGTTLILQLTDTAGLFFTGSEVTVYGAVISDQLDVHVLFTLDHHFQGNVLDNYSQSSLAAPPCDGALFHMNLNTTRDSQHGLSLMAPVNSTLAIFNATVTTTPADTATAELSTPPPTPSSTAPPTITPSAHIAPRAPVALIVGITVPVCILAVSVTVLAWYLSRRRSRQRAQEQVGAPSPFRFASHSVRSTESKQRLIHDSALDEKALSPRSAGGSSAVATSDSGSLSLRSPDAVSAVQDARVGAAVLTGVRSAGFSLNDLLASLDRMRHASTSRDTELGAPPPLYDTTSATTAGRS